MNVERQPLVDRARDAERAAVRVELLHELGAEDAHAAHSLVEAQVPSAGEVRVVLNASDRERAAPYERLDARRERLAVFGPSAVGRLRPVRREQRGDQQQRQDDAAAQGRYHAHRL